MLQARDEIVLVSKSAINLVPFTFTVKDLDETITLGYAPLSNSKGANIATLSTNSVHLNETNLGYTKSHDYFEIVNNTLKLKAGYSFDGSVIKDSNNQSIQLSSVDAITLGNHAWDQKEMLSFIEECPKIVRALNKVGIITIIK